MGYSRFARLDATSERSGASRQTGSLLATAAGTIELRQFSVAAVLALWPILAFGSAQVRPGVVFDNPLAAQSLDRLSATRERPLFLPARRLPEPPPVIRVMKAPPPPPPPPAPPSVALFGIIINGKEMRAIVRAGPTGQILRARIGDEIGGWKITRIDRRQITVSLADRSAIFALFSRERAGRVAPSTSPLTIPQVDEARRALRALGVPAAGNDFSPFTGN